VLHVQLGVLEELLKGTPWVLRSLHEAFNYRSLGMKGLYNLQVPERADRVSLKNPESLHVDGDTATVGGVIVETAPEAPTNPGDLFLQYFVDRGTSSPAAQRDLVSGVYFWPPTHAWPEGFPDVCPPADATSGFPPVYLELLGGDITVQDAPSD
jgi:hypothetical protein